VAQILPHPPLPIGPAGIWLSNHWWLVIGWFWLCYCLAAFVLVGFPVIVIWERHNARLRSRDRLTSGTRLVPPRGWIVHYLRYWDLRRLDPDGEHALIGLLEDSLRALTLHLGRSAKAAFWVALLVGLKTTPLGAVVALAAVLTIEISMRLGGWRAAYKAARSAANVDEGAQLMYGYRWDLEGRSSPILAWLVVGALIGLFTSLWVGAVCVPIVAAAHLTFAFRGFGWLGRMARARAAGDAVRRRENTRD
jgi:hypothetical protein